MRRCPFAIVLISSIVLTVAVSAIIYFRFPDTLVPDQQWQLFSAKLAFLSIMVAVGWLQYEYFSRICIRIHDDVFPYLNRQADAQRGDVKSATMNHVVWSDWMEQKWEQFQSRFPLLFGVIFVLVISVVADWVQNATTEKYPLHSHPYLTAISHGSFLVSLLLFTILLIYYLKSISSDMRYFTHEMQEHRDALLRRLGNGDKGMKK